MNVLMYSIPVIAILAASYLAIRSFKKNGSGAKALKVNFIALVLVFSVSAFGAVSAFAAEDDAATTAPVTTAEEEEEAGNGGAMAAGLGLLAAALATGLGGIGGGIAVASAAPAAIGATSEDPKAFGKALIFVALGESIALYGLVIAIMILSKIPNITL
ncbi:MAG: ATP synthase subunit C [Firmicutes bacterium]|nr:ATP synthase subunit C [Bacillota bacterium]